MAERKSEVERGNEKEKERGRRRRRRRVRDEVDHEAAAPNTANTATDNLS